MKCFIAIEESLLEELWMKHPELVVPFSRPFIPSKLHECSVRVQLDAQSVLVKSSANDEALQLPH